MIFPFDSLALISLFLLSDPLLMSPGDQRRQDRATLDPELYNA
jgi:hypothetical protein